MNAWIRAARKKNNLSERQLSAVTGVSRSTLRAIECGEGNATVSSLMALSKPLGREIVLFSSPEGNCFSEVSSAVISQKVITDGFDSWKGHFMEYVDECRRTLDPRLMLLPPVRDLDKKLCALLASITLELCFLMMGEAPEWAKKKYFLDVPWFVSEMESLKASAILESPWSFRRNNIFVLGNFLDRA